MKLFAQLSIDGNIPSIYLSYQDTRAQSLFENRDVAFKAAKSEESEVVFSSMLAIGNIARSGKNSILFVSLIG